jgi:hypothetical protein
MNREKRGPLALEEWARQLTDGYRGVTVRNMTTSWRNGLAFCALIHRFRPDLIEYDKLDPSDIIGNCSLAFEVAESKLGIPALLDPEDMAAHEVPDRLSVLTYVAQYYSAFKNAEKKSSVSSNPRDDDLKNRSNDKSKSPSPEKNVTKRRMDVNEDEIMDAVRRSMPKRPVLLASSVCSECQNPVYISERVMFMKKLYHRSCFRCSNCNRPLNPHTAECSLDELLFCPETPCHLELQRRSREKFMAEHKAQMLKDKEVEIIDISCSSGEVSCQQSEADDVSLSLSASVSGDIGDNSEHSFVGSDRIPTPSSSCHEDAEGARSLSPSKVKYSSPKTNKSPVNLSSDNQKEYQGDMDVRITPDSGQSSASDIIVVQESDSILSVHSELSANEPSDTLIIQSTSPEPDSAQRTLRNEWLHEQIDKPQQKDAEDIPDSPLPPIQSEEVNVKKKLESVREKPGVTIADQISKTVPPPLPTSLPPPVENVVIEEINLEPSITQIDLQNKESEESFIGEGNIPVITLESEESFIVEDNIPVITVESETSTVESNTSIQNEESESFPVDSNATIRIEDSPSVESDIRLPNESSEVSISEISPENKNENSESNDDIQILDSTTKLDLSNVSEKVEEETTLDSVTVPKDNKPSFSDKVTSSPKVKRRAPQPKRPPPPVTSLTPSPVPRTRNAKSVISNSTELFKKQDYYPAELNPFESEENLVVSSEQSNNSTISKEPKNPFEDDEDECQPIPVPSPRHRARKIPQLNKTIEVTSSSENLQSSNPSGLRGPEVPPQPSPRKSVASAAPKPYNPFEDDEDDIGEFVEERGGKLQRNNDESGSICSNLSDVSSVPTSTTRSVNTSDVEGSGSVRFRSRKNRRAPLPPTPNTTMTSPLATSTAANSPIASNLPPPSPKAIPKNSANEDRNSMDCNSIHPVENVSAAASPSSPQRKLIPVPPDLLKGLKNKTNRAAAQQYKKKRRAPPPRRRVDPLPEDAIKTELYDLEIKERELERQGITLESNIRTLMDQEENDNVENENHSEQLEEMMIQLWGIVNEKNYILRRQTELEYLRRGHRLEEMQAELEFQLRVLMDTPVNQRQDDHADVEQMLLDQMLKLVDERNEVVDWLDYHRQLDREEDLHVSNSLTRFSSNRHGGQNTVIEPIPDIVVSKSNSKGKKAEEKAIAKAKAKALKEEHKAAKKEKEKDKDHGSKLKLGLFTKRRSKKTRPDEDKDLDDSADF